MSGLLFNIVATLLKLNHFIIGLVSVSFIFAFLFLHRAYLNQVVQNYRVAESVLKLSELIMNVDSKESLYREILQEAVSAIDGGLKGSIITIDEDGEHLTFQAVIGFNLEEVQKINLKLKDTFLYRNSQGDLSKSVIVENISSYNKGYVDEDVYQNMIATEIKDVRYTISAPLTINNKLFGMLNIDSVSEVNFSNTDVQMVEAFTKEMSKILKINQLFEKTVHSSKYDHLTNTLNRGAFVSIISKMMVSELYTNLQFSLMYIDLDGLKAVNDRYGHEFGDLYIQRFAEGARQQLKGEETIARFGGDEFVFLLMRPKNEIMTLEENLIAWFKKHPIETTDGPLSILYSGGHATFPDEADNLGDLISLADNRMYTNKRMEKKLSNHKHYHPHTFTLERG